MRSTIRSTFGLAAALAASLVMAPVIAADGPVCLELDSDDWLGVSPIVYKLQVLDMGNGAYLLAGIGRRETITDPPRVIERPVRGSAALIGELIEAAIDSADFGDWPSTETVEGLTWADAHLVLDPVTLGGTFERASVTVATDDDTPSTLRVRTGTVTAIPCPF